MRPQLVFVAALAACAPPEIDLNDDTGAGGGSSEPRLRIIQPLDGSDIELQPDCSLSMNVAVDVDNFDVLEGQEVVDGEGHWHVALLSTDDPYGLAVFDQFYVLERPGPFSPSPQTIDVRLVDHQHFDVEGDSVAARVEFDLVDSTGACN